MGTGMEVKSWPKYYYENYSRNMTRGFIRFANIFHITNSSVNIMWKKARMVKVEKSIGLNCARTGLYHDESDKLSTLIAFEKSMQITSTDEIIPNMKQENLKIAAEIFIYLNICDGNFKPWF